MVAGHRRPVVEVSLHDRGPGIGAAVEQAVVLGVDAVDPDRDGRIALGGQHLLDVVVAEVAGDLGQGRPARPAPVVAALPGRVVAVGVAAVEEDHQGPRTGVGPRCRLDDVPDHLDRLGHPWQLHARQLVVAGDDVVVARGGRVGRQRGGRGQVAHAGGRVGLGVAADVVEAVARQDDVEASRVRPLARDHRRRDGAPVVPERGYAERHPVTHDRRAVRGDRQPARRPPRHLPGAGSRRADPPGADAIGTVCRGGR